MSEFLSRLHKNIMRYRLEQKPANQNPSGTDWNQIMTMMEYGMMSEFMAKSLLSVIDDDIQHQIDFPRFLHNAPLEEQLFAQGKPHLRLGKLIDNDLDFGLRVDQPVFIICAGLTGFGKSNTARVLLQEIDKWNRTYPDQYIVVIALDSKGGVLADLAVLFGWKHYHFRDTLRLALENPPGVPVNDWINTIATLFCARAQLKAAWVTLANVLRWLLTLLNPKPVKRFIWPDFQLILDVLNSLPDTAFSAKAEYTRALKQKLEGITRSCPQSFAAFQGFQVQGLIDNKESAVIAISQIDPPWVKQFVNDLLSMQSLKPRIETGHLVDQLEVLYVNDEADADISLEAEKLFEGMSPGSELNKKGRELGIGTCNCVSSLLGVPPIMRQNTTVHIHHRVSDALPKKIAGQTLMLPQHGDLTFGHLQPGEAIARQIGPWPHAMLVKMDYLPPNRTPVPTYDTHPYIPAKRLKDLPEVLKVVARFRSHLKPQKSRGKDETRPKLADKAKQLLILACKHPYLPVIRLFELLEIKRFETQKLIRKVLEDQKLAKFEEPRIAKKKLLLIEITEKGYQAIKQNPPEENRGRGGITHRHYAHWIKGSFKQQGLEAHLEWRVLPSNHPVDVAVPIENHWRVFEISVTARENLVSHVQACFALESSVNLLTIVTGTNKESDQLKRELQSNEIVTPFLEQITFEGIDAYLQKAFK